MAYPNSSAFPSTLDDLKGAGYRFDNYAHCRECGQEIEWWITPAKRNVALNRMPEASSQPVTHRRTCPKVNGSLFG